MPPSGGVPGMPNWEETSGRHRTLWRDFISRLAWEHLGIPQEELEKVAGEKDVWPYLACCHSNPDRWRRMDRWMDGCYLILYFLQCNCSKVKGSGKRKRWEPANYQHNFNDNINNKMKEKQQPLRDDCRL